MKKILIPLLLLYFGSLQAQSYVDTNNLRSKFALKKSKEKFKDEITNSIQYVYNIDQRELNEDSIRKAFSNAVLTYSKQDSLKRSLKFLLNNYKDYSDRTVYSALEAAYSLFPNSFNSDIDSLVTDTDNPKLFAIGVNYLSENSDSNFSTDKYLNLLRKKEFKLNYRTKEIIAQLESHLEGKSNGIHTNRPPLKELLTHSFQQNKTIIYSFFREDRNYPGITIIKKPNGKFVRNDSGAIFHIKHLARSLSNLPYYLQNGNTPEGLYSVVGFYVSPTESIGPTPNVLTRIPFEVPTSIFYHDTTLSRRWNLNDYLNLLPDSWKEYSPMKHSYQAGKIGRRKIVMHGAVDVLSFYKEQPYYPLTPTRGCIASTELWDENTGNNVKSDQAKLMNAFFSTGELDGFLVVLELDNKEKPVTIEEIKPYILDAEK